MQDKTEKQSNSLNQKANPELLTESEMLKLFTQFYPSSVENARWYQIAKAQLLKCRQSETAEIAELRFEVERLKREIESLIHEVD